MNKKAQAVSAIRAANQTIVPDSAQPILKVQREYIALETDSIEPVDNDQKLFRGHILALMAEQVQNMDTRDWVYFSRLYQPETNDVDKVFTEVKFDDKVIGSAFTLIPLNKVRLFVTPPSLIHIARPSAKDQIRI